MPKPVKEPKATTKPVVELPPGVLAAIELTVPVLLDKMQVSRLYVRKPAGVREMAAVQIAYRKAGIQLTNLGVLSAVANSEFLAVSTLIDEMCVVPPGTGDSLDPVVDWHTAALAIRPFVKMLP